MLAQMVYRNNKFVKVINCLCPDGKRRVAILGQPDTWFATNARVKAYGKTISGFVTGTEKNDYKFFPYSYGKNRNVITGKS